MTHPNIDNFNSHNLNSLPSQKLAVALFDEAHATAAMLGGDERQRLEQRVEYLRMAPGEGVEAASGIAHDTTRSLGEPAMRGVILLQNALDGDRASYRPGVDAMRQGLEETGIGWAEAHEGVELTGRLIRDGAYPEEYDTMRELAIDLLVRMRQWRRMPGYETEYAEAAAGLAVVFRDSPE